jgi:hypothetical protein
VKPPGTITRRIEQGTPIPPGGAERFVGYGVMGLPFASGHVLALRRFPSSSIGPGYTAIWHRSPQGSWTIWANIEPTKACPRYFGTELEQAIQTPIELSWPEPFRMTAKIDAGRALDWEIELGSTVVTRSLSAAAKMIPGSLWRYRPVRTVMGAAAGPLLGAGRLSLDGIAPNGQWFEANPKLIWFVTGGRALLHGADLGPSGSLAQQGSLGGFLIPQRGLFAVGRSFFEPFAEGRHLAVTTREANREP